MLIVAICVLVPMLFCSFIAFDRLVWLEYHSYRKQWDEDGRPHGFFFVPREIRILGGLGVRLGSTLAFQRCAWMWLVSTPDWAKDNALARRLLLVLRVSVAVWNVGMLIIIILFLRVNTTKALSSSLFVWGF